MSDAAQNMLRFLRVNSPPADPVFRAEHARVARVLLDTLRRKGAPLPRYYEVMLKVSCENNMPCRYLCSSQ